MTITNDSKKKSCKASLKLAPLCEGHKVRMRTAQTGTKGSHEWTGEFGCFDVLLSVYHDGARR